MGNVIAFPSRAQPRIARVRPQAEAVKWFDATNGTWVVDVWSGSEDSIAMLGRYLDEAAADRRIARWAEESRPGGPA